MTSPAAMFSVGNGLSTALSGNNGSINYPAMPNPYNPALIAPLRQAQQSATDQEVALQEQQSQLAMDQGFRDATQKAYEVNAFRKQQANAYSGSGVLLEGSPMRVLEETRRLGQQEIDAIQSRANAQSDLLHRQAQIVGNQGKASLLSQDQEFNFNRNQFDINQVFSRMSRYNTTSPWGSFLTALGGALPGYTKKSPLTPVQGAGYSGTGYSNAASFAPSSFVAGDNY